MSERFVDRMGWNGSDWVDFNIIIIIIRFLYIDFPNHEKKL